MRGVLLESSLNHMLNFNQVRELGGSSAYPPSSMNHWPGIETEDPVRGWVEPVWGETTYTPYIFIFIYTWSLHYPSSLGSFAKHLFLDTFDTCWGRFMQKRPFIFQAGAGYIH